MRLKEVFQLIETRIRGEQERKSLPIRVAINGVEGTGKTVFAIGLSEYLSSVDMDTHHIGIDGFHFNKAHRYRQGRDSAMGYYEDSYDEAGFRDKVLLASQREEPTITRATHDIDTDKYLEDEPVQISSNAVIITDGAYLFKSTYAEHWDLKIYLKVDFEVAMDRGVARDTELLGDSKNAEMKYRNRYHKASKIYIKEVGPESVADLVFDNTDFDDLKVLKS